MQHPILQHTLSRTKRCAFLASVLLPGSWACDAESLGAAGDSKEFAAISRKLISTAYDKATRTIYARGEPQGTYNVLITTKDLFTGTCENLTPIMEPVPQKEIEATVCSGLGLILAVLQGGVNACVVSKESNIGVPIYHYNYTSAFNVNLNYNVVDVGNNVLFGSSGWQPALGNGCPRDGFPY